MTTNFNDIYVLFPELILVFFSVISLLIGVCLKRNVVTTSNIICIFGLLISLIFNNLNQKFIGTYFNYSYSISELNILSKNIIIICGLIGLLLLQDNRRFETSINFEVPVLMAISIVGMLVLQSAQSFLNLYLSIELLTLPLYILSASNIYNSKSSEAGLKYFILGSLSSCILLFGISLIYASTLHLNTAMLPALSFNSIINIFDQHAANEIARASSALFYSPYTLEIGLLFVVCGMCFKMAAVPFHMWAVDVYEGSPTIITSFLATVPKIAIILFTINFYFLILTKTTIINFGTILTILFALSIIVGSLTAIHQTNIKRMLAYSSIGHIGFGMIALSVNSLLKNPNFTFDIVAPLSACVMYYVIYACMSFTFFACILALRKNGKELENLLDLKMLAEFQPKIAFALAVILFSMAGIPPFAGFFAKLGVIKIIIFSKSYIVSVIYILGSIISTFYYLNMIKIMYFDQSKDTLDYKGSKLSSVLITAGTAFNILFIFYWSNIEGFVTGIIQNYINYIAS